MMHGVNSYYTPLAESGGDVRNLVHFLTHLRPLRDASLNSALSLVRFMTVRAFFLRCLSF